MKSKTIHLAVLVATSLIAQAHARRCAADVSIATDQIYGHKAGMALTLDVVRPSENSNGIGLLYMVSQGWVSDYFDLRAAMETSKQRNGRFSSLTDRGYTLFIVRHGSAPHFTIPAAVADVRRALRYIRFHAAQWQIDPDRLGVFGNSAGGHLALMLGTTADDGNQQSADPIERTAARVAAVVAYYPPVDLRQRSIADQSSSTRPRSKRNWGPLDLDASLQETVSPISHVSGDDAPTLLIHGDQDLTVPLENSVNMHKAFQVQEVKSKLIVIAGAAHAFPGEHGKRAATALADWFDLHLLSRSQP